VGGTILYNTHTLKPFKKELGLDSQRVKKLASKPATLLISIDFSFPFRGGGALRYSVPKWLLFLN
jgi:hypothetical protein